MSIEKRRFFRINDTVGLTYQRLDRGSSKDGDTAADVWGGMTAQDEKIEALLREVAVQSPKVAELVRAINQKLERVVGQLAMENKLVGRMANRAREVNISACGAGFLSDEDVPKDARLQLELQLLPGTTKVHTKARVIACEPHGSSYFWRVEFFDITAAVQEVLIQHIVQRQSALLKTRRDS